MHLRKRDYLKEVADGMNRMIDDLRERRKSIEALQELWREALPAVKAGPDGERIAVEINRLIDGLMRVEPPGEETKNLLYRVTGGGQDTPRPTVGGHATET